jgi:DNA-binding GntR family transcriptional regulator
VTELKAEEARDLFEVRRCMDPLAAALAAQRRTKADIAEVRDALQGLAPLPGNPAYAHLLHHRRFHAAIYRASHNELLIETLESLWDKADRYRRLALEVERDPAEVTKKADEHRMLMESVIAGDSDSAANVMREHIDTSLGAKAAWRLMKP